MSTTYPEVTRVAARAGDRAGEDGRRRKPVRLSFAQQRLWFLDKLQPGSAAYNVPTVLKLTGAIDRAAFQKGLNAIVERHESLRTVFPGTDEPVQKVLPPPDVPLALIDLAGKPECPPDAEIKRIISEETQRPFDLAKDLMIRATLLRLSAAEHLLILVTHHIASDEWSLRVLFQEWSELYRATLEGREAQLPELPMQYADFSEWQREWLKSDECQEQLGYWRERLQAAPVLQLPADRPRPACQSFRGALRSRVMPKEIAAGLKQAGKQERCTPFITLLAGFKVLLQRYTSSEDIVVGCPIAGRSRMETEPMIGFFVNTLALRTSLSGNPSFRTLLKHVRETTLGAYANQEIPFDRLVEEVHPERSATHMPLVQVMFSLNNDFMAREIFPGIRTEEVEVDTRTSKFDLTVSARETPRGLEVAVEYNTDLFDEDRIDRFLGHFEQLLKSIVANPDESIGRLEMLTPAERNQMLVEWNQTAREYPRECSVTRIFEGQVAKTPDAMALKYGGQSITYRELNARANQLAQHLLNSGAGPQSLVGVYMDRSIEMVTAFLGILKAGSAYVPLDLSYPKERLHFMVSDAGMPLVLTESARRAELPDAVKTLCLDTEWDVINAQPRRLPPNSATGDSLAYIIYTSGSTGQPKGVAVPHRGITRLVLNTDYVSLNAEDRIAQASNASFDAATFEIWGALLNGATAVGVSKDVALSPAEFRQFACREGITTLFLTTALFNQIAREAPGTFGTMNTVLFGGEAVDPKWVRAVLECAPPKRLLHVYGPTENTTFSAWHLVREVPEESESAPILPTVPIGRPIANSTLYILGPQMLPLPVGVPGELYVGGDGLAQGYWNRPDLNVEKFVSNPFDASPEARLYRTGDLARFDAAGNAEFIGRVDHQVKLRGFRIELGEIESLLARHPAIANAVVLMREDMPGDKRLVAYLIARDQQPMAAELKTYLKEHLPDYMVPSVFLFLEEFPRTPNQKVDRKALPAPEQNRPELNKTFIAPRNGTEQQLAKIWEKVLGVQPIGVADNFFELGGHSLLAVRLFSQIEKLLNKKLPLATLFRAPTIEEIARVIRDDNPAKSWFTIVDIQPKGTRAPFFWIHTLGGDGGGGFFYYRKLAELLGPDQPSFGIRSPVEPFSRIEEMARFYIEEIRRRQPEGPYFLGGFCFGGNVAYEMAQQLSRAGEKIGLLVTLESSPPNVNSKQSWSATAAKYSLENFVENVKGFVGESPSKQLTLLKSKGKRLTERLKKKIAPEQENGSVELNQILDLSTYPEGYVKYAQTHWRALTEYQPAPYPGEIKLFRARKQSLSNFNHTLGWDCLVGERVEVTVIPGTHENMLQEPNVQIVAAKLRDLIEAAHVNQDTNSRISGQRAPGE